MWDIKTHGKGTTKGQCHENARFADRTKLKWWRALETMVMGVVLE